MFKNESHEEKFCEEKYTVGLFLKNVWENKCVRSEEIVKGTFSGLRQFLATERPLKMMKNAFYFTSDALFVLKMFKFLSCLDLCDIPAWLRNNCNTHISQYLEK